MPLVEIAAAIGQQAAVTAIEPLIRDLLDVQDRQDREMRAILERFDSLRTAPWRRARLLIEEASEAKSEADRRARLKEAYDALFEAYSHFPEATGERATAAIDLAIVMGLLGDAHAARRWARSACDDQVAAVASTVAQVRKALNLRFVKAAQRGDFWDWTEGDRADLTRVIPPELRTVRSSPELRSEASSSAGRRDSEHGDAPRTPAGRELRRLGGMVADHVQYREVCASLDPGSAPVAYELEVDLSARRKARLVWRASPDPGAAVMTVSASGPREEQSRPLTELRAEQSREARSFTVAAWRRLGPHLEPGEGALILDYFQTPKQGRAGLILLTDRRMLIVFNWVGGIRKVPLEQICTVESVPERGLRGILRIVTGHDAIAIMLRDGSKARRIKEFVGARRKP